MVKGSAPLNYIYTIRKIIIDLDEKAHINVCRSWKLIYQTKYLFILLDHAYTQFYHLIWPFFSESRAWTRRGISYVSHSHNFLILCEWNQTCLSCFISCVLFFIVTWSIRSFSLSHKPSIGFMSFSPQHDLTFLYSNRTWVESFVIKIYGFCPTTFFCLEHKANF